MIKDYFKLALRNISHRKLRSWLTVLGIFISIATIFVLISLSLGLESAVEEQFRLLGTDKIFIQPRGQLAGPGTGGATQLTIEDVNVVEKVIGVEDYTYWVAATGEIEFADGKRYFSVVGFPLDQSSVFLESGAYKIDEGQFLEEGDTGEIMVGSHYKYNNLFRKSVNDRDTLTINEMEFRVKTILQPIGNPGDDRLIYMSETDFKKLFPDTNRIDTIIVQVEAGEDVEEVSDRIEKALDKSRNVDEDSRDFSLLTPDQLLESFGVILNVITAFLLGVAGISLVVGGIGIANTMYTSVLERTKEIGVMKAVGAKNSDIALIFVIESGFLGVVGGLIGITLGLIISKSIELIAINQLGTELLRAVTPASLFAGLLAFAFLAGAVSGTLPAIRASKINPVDALRYE